MKIGTLGSSYYKGLVNKSLSFKGSTESPGCSRSSESPGGSRSSRSSETLRAENKMLKQKIADLEARVKNIEEQIG